MKEFSISEIIDAYKKLTLVSRELNDKLSSSGINFKVDVELTPLIDESSDDFKYKLLLKLMASVDVERAVLSRFDEEYFSIPGGRREVVEVLRLGFSLPLPQELIRDIFGDELEFAIKNVVEEFKSYGKAEEIRAIPSLMNAVEQSGKDENPGTGIRRLKGRLLSPVGLMVAEALVEFAKAGIELPRLIG